MSGIGGGARSWRSPVATVGDLPAVGTDGDVRVVTSTDQLYEWDATTVGWKLVGGGGTGPSPASAVTSETGYGQSPAAGTAATYSRGDHTHGTPALPTPAAIGAQATSQKDQANGYPSLDGTSKVPVAEIPDLSATYQPLAQKDQANGYAGLDGTSKVPAAEIPDLSASYQPLAQKNQANGYAGLDGTSKVPSAEIPDLSATYQLLAQKGAASGYPSLDAATLIPRAQLGNVLTRVRYVDGGQNPTSQDGSIFRPYSTIQAALSALPAQDGGDVTNRQVWVILIASGNYDESLVIPPNMRIALLGLGPIGLGTFTGANYDPAGTARNVTWNQTVGYINGVQSQLWMGTVLGFAGEGLTTFPAFQTGFRISGNIVISSSVSTACSFEFQGRVHDIGATGKSIDGTGFSGDLNLYLYNSRFASQVVGNFTNAPGNGMRLQAAERCRFGGLVNVLKYSRVNESQFNAGMTVNVGATPDIQPSGMMLSYFQGTFTGPAGSFVADATTKQWFDTNAAVFAGGATFAPLDKAPGVGYTPGTPAEWASPVPTTAQSAIDRLADAVYALRGNVAIP